MADMFGRTYGYVNVMLLSYVEPVLTILMILGALYALFRLPKAKHVAKAFIWLGINRSTADCISYSCMEHGRYAVYFPSREQCSSVINHDA